MTSIRFFRHSTQLFRHYIPTEYILLGIIEFLLLMTALVAGLELRFLGSSWHRQIGYIFPKALLYAIVMQMSLIALGVYQRQPGRFIEVVLLRVGAGLLLGLIPLSMSFYFAPTFFLGRGVLMLTVILSFIMIAVVRLFFRKIVKEHTMWSRVLVLGSGEAASLIRESVKTGDLTGVTIIGYIAMPDDRQHEIKSDCIALDGPLIQYVEEMHIDEIVLAVDERRAGLPDKELLECRMSGIDVLDLMTFFERRTGKIRLDILNPSWLYLSDGFRESVFRRLGKRGIDIVVVLLLLPITLPVMLLIAFAILVESRGSGPILYRQVRVKQDGKLFEIYKFRSMVADAEPDGKVRWASRNDSRITSVGRILRKGRLDELPQLFNVLRGDMSFVGPRPERPEFVAEFADAIPYYDERHRVKPGLTGWAQICYPYGDSEEDALKKLQYDLYYVKNYSVFLDLLILLQTAEVVMLGKGAQ